MNRAQKQVVIENLVIDILAGGEWANEAMHTISELDNMTRKEIRKELELEGHEEMPRNLFYNYQTQEWI